MSRTNESKFKLDVAALLPFFDDEGAGAETVGAAFFDELAEQLGAAGAPDAPFEEQIRTLLFSHSEHNTIREALSPAYIHGESAVDTARRALASHLAMQRAGEEMPSVEHVATWMYERDAGRGEWARAGDIVRRDNLRRAESLIDLFRPVFARLTQERDEALKQRDENGNEGDELEDEAIALRLENAALRARIAELESRPEPGADVVERLRIVFNEAYEDAHERGETGRPKQTAGVHAVIAALATMGEEAWPSGAEVGQTMQQKRTIGDQAQAALDLCRSRVSPVLGALRVENAETTLVLRGAAKLLGVDPNDRPADIARALSVRAGRADRGIGGGA